MESLIAGVVDLAWSSAEPLFSSEPVVINTIALLKIH